MPTFNSIFEKLCWISKQDLNFIMGQNEQFFLRVNTEYFRIVMCQNQGLQVKCKPLEKFAKTGENRYILGRAGFALALKKLSPSLSPNEKSWGQPGDSWGQILKSWGQMNNMLDKILDWSEL